ncbi:Lrp/AsnC family transcriptional regulator [Haloprofundus salilacus]|uniref:Lrp/AsnC family transcriptional regulator n=1 Tax=Haloprofundus salilacus TaxID=2876190 RepID=UPI001CCBAC8E|nr:Lrp/AsnC family transcriptional regulator [Haloprofundus salilacus]
MPPATDDVSLDRVDRAILQLLQRDARHTTAVDLAERVGVSDGTIRNRIEKLEEEGVIQGYAPLINYEAAGYQLQIRFMCSTRIVEREALAREALQIEGVVEVHEVMTGRNNIEIKVVAPHHDDVTRVATKLDEMGMDIESEDLIRHHYFRPFNHFGTENISSDVEDEHPSEYDVGVSSRQDDLDYRSE